MNASLTETQMATFNQNGHLRLPAAFAPEAAIQLQERMWAELMRFPLTTSQVELF